MKNVNKAVTILHIIFDETPTYTYSMILKNTLPSSVRTALIIFYYYFFQALHNESLLNPCSELEKNGI